MSPSGRDGQGGVGTQATGTRAVSRILVAEPSRTLTTLIRLTLAADDVALEFVANGRDALSTARARRPRLVIVDARLPGLDGYDLTAALRRDPLLRDTPVLLTLADYESPDLARISEAGVTDVLTKPFERHALLERVRALLEQAPEPLPEADLEGPGWGDAAAEAAPASAAAATVAPAEVEGMVAAEVERRLPGLLGAAVEAAVTRAVEARLPALVGALIEERLTEHLARLAEPQMQLSIDAAIARAMPDVVEHAAYGMGPKAEAAMRAAVAEAVGPKAEDIAWKVVPELAEEIIRKEIARLTEESPSE